MRGGVIKVVEEKGVCRLLLSNKRHRNALNDAMMDQLICHLNKLKNSSVCRIVILEGDGDDFCAGRDLQGLDPQDMPSEVLRNDLERIRRLMAEVYYFPKPIVAVIRGYCLGLGAALACLSDMAFASAETRFGFPEAKVGISPSFTAISLTISINLKAAMPLLLTGEQIDGHHAERIGLVTACTKPDELDILVEHYLHTIADTSATANRMCKALVTDSIRRDFDAALVLAKECAIAAATTADAKEGRQSFLEKRKPLWSAT